MKPIKAFAHAKLSPSDEARVQLLGMSRDLTRGAAEAHSEGVRLAKAAARAEQLSELLTDEEIVSVRNQLIESGEIEIVADTNAPGGVA